MTTMTRKYYIRIAEILRVARKRAEIRDIETAHAMQSFIQTEIADFLAADNTRFDRERFNKACMPTGFDAPGRYTTEGGNRDERLRTTD